MKILLHLMFLFFASQLFAQSFIALPNMPEPVSNNAVASGYVNDIYHVYSFCGIDETKTPEGIHNKVFFYLPGLEIWLPAPSVPDPNGGKIAASASTVKNKIYVIGGYHVDSNFSEVSSDKVHIFDPVNNLFEDDGAPIPVPIDDQVQVVWRDSLIFVISGWSNTTNVENVQIYNPETNEWSVGTPVPNDSNYRVFGGNGTIIGDTIYYLGGAKITSAFAASRHFRKGVINPDNPTEITWTGETNLDAIAYRPASLTYNETAFWLGGSERTYNFDGLAYSNGNPVEPKDKILSYKPGWPLTHVQESFGQMPPVMDLRGVAKFSETEFVIAGGMVEGPNVTSQAWKINMEQIVSIENEVPEVSPFFQVYPNPTRDILHINFKGYFTVELSNLLGGVLQEKETFETTSLNLSNLQNGIYIVSIKKNGVAVHAEKIFIQH